MKICDSVNAIINLSPNLKVNLSPCETWFITNSNIIDRKVKSSKDKVSHHTKPESNEMVVVHDVLKQLIDEVTLTVSSDFSPLLNCINTQPTYVQMWAYFRIHTCLVPRPGRSTWLEELINEWVADPLGLSQTNVLQIKTRSA